MDVRLGFLLMESMRVRVGQADVKVFDTSATLASGAAEAVAGFIRTEVPRIRSQRRLTVAMAGGSTPVAMYRKLSTMDVPWQRVCAWVGDERYVPPDHADCNGAMIASTLLDATRVQFLRPAWAPSLSAADAAADYEAELLAAMAGDGDGPRPDLVLAGMGGDGHTLSLFPGSPALDIADRWYAATEPPAQGPPRLTATLPLVHRAARIFVLVSGSSKASALAEALQPSSELVLPVRRLMDGEASVTWLVDRDAASDLDLR